LLKKLAVQELFSKNERKGGNGTGEPLDRHNGLSVTVFLVNKLIKRMIWLLTSHI